MFGWLIFFIAYFIASTNYFGSDILYSLNYLSIWYWIIFGIVIILLVSILGSWIVIYEQENK